MRRGGVLVAELGAVFTVEMVEEGWECRMESGECVEVLGTGLKSQRQGKARAEEQATRMAAQALAQKAPSGRRRPRPAPERKPAGRLAAPAEKPEAAPGPAEKPAKDRPEPKSTKPADAKPADAGGVEITFDEIEDGCIMGRAGGACWVANEKEVAWTKDIDPKLQAAVEQVAARYYREKREAKAAERAAAREQREAAKRAAREQRQAAAEERRAAKTAAKKTGKNAAAKKTGKKAAAKKTAARKTRETEAETSKATKTVARKVAKKGPRGRRGKAAGKDAAKEEEVVTVKTAEKQTKGPIAWTNQDGELRGTAAHGTFLVQPEGTRHALYFYEPGGQSRHLQSGTICDMRKAAEEMAARGQPAPSSDKLSPEMEAQMMRMFVTGAVGGNPA